MNMKTQSKDLKILLLISAIAFSVLGIINLDELYFQFRYGFTTLTEFRSFSSVIYWINSLLYGLTPLGCILLAFGIFFGKEKPAIIGCGINILSLILNIIVAYGQARIPFRIGDLMHLLAWVSLILLFLLRDNYSFLGGIGAAIAHILTIVFASFIYIGILDVILFVIGAVGLAIARMPNSVKSTSTPYQATYDVKNGADTMLKLKKLLDDGIITQEEFDAKKKQLLGL